MVLPMSIEQSFYPFKRFSDMRIAHYLLRFLLVALAFQAHYIFTTSLSAQETPEIVFSTFYGGAGTDRRGAWNGHLRKSNLLYDVF